MKLAAPTQQNSLSVAANPVSKPENTKRKGAESIAKQAIERRMSMSEFVDSLPNRQQQPNETISHHGQRKS
ncbi:MAG: hypothetical protein SFT91_02460 [Rickettsiaceae bacterium]|nr:hypothetical protein [Rickettsiaceae bacterium]